MARKNKKTTKPVQSRKAPSIGRALRPYYLALIMALAFVLYGNTLGHQYAFDDSIVITGNSFTQKGIKGIPDLLTRDFFEGLYGKQTELSGGRYRPLSLVMFAVEYQFFGEEPLIGHLMNIFFYGLTVWLLFLALERAFYMNSAIPHIASFLFLIHPIHTEVVANIKSRDEILCLFFLMLTLYAVFRAIDKDRQKWTVIGLVAYGLALFAKETAITYLAILPLFIFVFRKEHMKEKLPFFIGLGAIAFLYMGLRIYLVGMIGGTDSADIMENPFVTATFVEKHGTISLILLKYLGLLFFPHPLTADYSFNQIPFVGFGNIWAILGLVTHVAMLVYALLRIWKRDILALGLLCYLAPLSIVSNIVFNIGAPMGERFLFIPSLGFCLIAAWALVKIFNVKKEEERVNINYGVFLVLGLIFLISSYKIIDRNQDWYNNMTLFDADVQTSPNSAKMLYYHGNSHLKYYIANKTPENLRHLDLAERSFKKGLEINPTFLHISYNLGNLYDLKENGREALKYLQKSLEIEPNHINSHALLGKVYGRYLNNNEKAIYHLEKTVYEFKKDNVETLQNLGNIYAMAGRNADAIKIFNKMVKKQPYNGSYYLNLAITYDRMGDKDQSQHFFNKAFELDPSLRK